MHREEQPLILLITNKSDITTDFIVKRLSERNILFYRLNTEDIGNFVRINFDFSAKEFYLFDDHLAWKINLLKVKSVYYRRPGIYDGFKDLSKGDQNFIKSELVYTLEGLYRILDCAYWVNKVQAIRNAENKIYQLLLAQKIGFDTPKSIVSNVRNAVIDFYDDLNHECIVKPIKSGLIAGDKEEGVIFTNRIKLENSNVDRLSSCPMYLQNMVKKKADVRVTVVGNRFFAALIHSQDIEESQVDWRRASKPLRHSAIELPEHIQEKCRSLLEMLSLNFGAIDFVIDENNNFIFLEINPNGQWAWIEKRLNFNISHEITELLATNAL